MTEWKEFILYESLPVITVQNHNVSWFRIIRPVREMKWVKWRASLSAGLWRHGISTSQGKGNANGSSLHASFKWALIIQYHVHWIENPILKSIGMCKCVWERAERDWDREKQGKTFSNRENTFTWGYVVFSHLVLSSNSRVVRDMKFSLNTGNSSYLVSECCVFSML